MARLMVLVENTDRRSIPTGQHDIWNKSSASGKLVQKLWQTFPARDRRTKETMQVLSVQNRLI